MGYHHAGYEVTGVDHRPQQPRYPFRFIQADALEYLVAYGHKYDCIHASPPCQLFSSATFARPDLKRDHKDLLTPTLKILYGLQVPYVVENVMGAPLSPFGAVLCGLMFGLKVLRHRRFETSHLVLTPHHPSHRGVKIGRDGFVCVAGHGDGSYRHRKTTPPDHRNKASWERAMQIDWMSRNGLAQAIPPAYTRFLGLELYRQLFRED